MDEQLKQSALDFHEFPVPGKIQVSPTKPLATQRDLALAYSPGVAAPCLEIEKDPLAAYKYTARGNLVAVISNGTAVLGLGNIGALAGKPVMEGKGVLFKKFAGIDVFDIEVDELDPDKFINVVAALEPTFGGINLEDIKAPECFYIEQKLRERMNIPVFHDDQHGTAIISTAAILNGLRVVEKNISDVRMVVSGAGAAAIACMNLLVALGMQKHNIVVCDSKGVIYKGREPNMAETKAAYAVDDSGKRTLDEVIDGADIFLGCSGPIADFDAYIDKLTEFVYKTNLFMKPIFSQARKDPKRVVLPEGEEARVLHATQELITLGLAKPILIGRPSVIEMRIQKLGLQIKAGVDFEIVNNESDPRFKEYWSEYYQIMKRRGVTQEQAQRAMSGNHTAIGAIMVQRGEADAMICGTIGDYHEHFSVVKAVFGYRDGVHTAGAMNALLLPSGNTFIADTYVNEDPTPEQLAEITVMAAETVRRFGIEPKVALLSHSNFGSSNSLSASKMRETLERVRERAPDLMIDGEMHGDAALVESIRNDRMPDSPLKGAANILVMPNMEAARISYNLLRVSSSEGVTVGPVLMGVSKPVHVLTPIASVRRIVNMVALAVVEAQTTPL
ncbi:NADP-dependent malic enzyme [Salmonella enterica]|nr:NADP-dependent malic enzyme [Salmonella enterica]EDG4116963.1 hypothetical protein [Salmonella enterica]EDK0315275.1 hypothetical protein [Salmonella enterica]EFQ7267810.1 NADP-dependent malic enzyme [Salmonella enterica]EFT9400646.1 NADP-dependent malic enzyme [Salmonella enterica]